MIRDSRRLPGINLLFDGPGAVLDVSLHDEDDALVAAWRTQAARMLAALGWDSALRTRRFPGGASLFLSAPVDALYAATEINEWAWAAVESMARGEPEPPVSPGAAKLRESIRREANAPLVALQQAAAARGVAFHADHKAVSVGGGTGSQVWAARDPRHPEAPAPKSVNWRRVHDVPTVLITGSNGKTTTTRLLASVVRAWGRVPGSCSTDNIVVGDEILDAGDWSGPMGARAVLRNPRVEVALLETARGGILRRGLASTRADAAIVTNIAEDHFGEWGISDLRGIAETKLVVGRVVPRLVLNADDETLVEQVKVEKAMGRITADIGWFALEPSNPVVRSHISVGNTAAVLDDGQLVFWHGRRRTPVVAAADVPLTLGGVARYNIANALGVILLASAIGIDRAAIARGLTDFKGTPRENPGRSHRFTVKNATVIVDFAHNPHGMRALVDAAMRMPAKRKIVILGQAGDRDDESIRGLARETWPWIPDLVVLKEMERYLRGRRPGEATGLLKDEFLKLGASPDIFRHADSELAAVELALAEARPGDLVLLPTHAQRDEVLALVEQRAEIDARPAEPHPG